MKYPYSIILVKYTAGNPISTYFYTDFYIKCLFIHKYNVLQRILAEFRYT